MTRSTTNITQRDCLFAPADIVGIAQRKLGDRAWAAGPATAEIETDSKYRKLIGNLQSFGGHHGMVLPVAFARLPETSAAAEVLFLLHFSFR